MTRRRATPIAAVLDLCKGSGVRTCVIVGRLAGWSQARIAAWLGVTQQAVNAQLGVIEKRNAVAGAVLRGGRIKRMCRK